MTQKIEGFLWCRSPDDAVVSAVEGVGTGSGAQYVGPKFVMDVGPSQKAMSLTLDADTPGDKRAGCTIKYAPFEEITTSDETTTQNITYSGVIEKTGTDVSGYLVKLINFTPGLNATNQTNATIAKALIDVDAQQKEIEVGSSAKIGSLVIELVDANQDNATVNIAGTNTISIPGATTKMYQKMNGEYVASLEDSQYRQLRLDKTIPFVEKKMSNPQCPEGKTNCKVAEVIDVGGTAIPMNYIIIGAIVLVLLVVFLLGKTSRS